MSVQNELMALETLLYVFQNQMELGKSKLTLTLKHRDGVKEFISGNIDRVFKSDLIGEIETGDMVLLEHFDGIRTANLIPFEKEVDSLGTLVDMSKSIETCCQFIIPKGNDVVYFLIKDHPMARYTIFRNEIFSDKVFGKCVYIMNNITGKIRAGNGVSATLSTFSR